LKKGKWAAWPALWKKKEGEAQKHGRKKVRRIDAQKPRQRGEGKNFLRKGGDTENMID